MDINVLELYGIGQRRINVVEFIRGNCYRALALVIISFYALIIMADLISHDFWYEDHAQQFLSKVEDTSDSKYTSMKKSILYAEFVVLTYFIFNHILHLVGYGLLFLKNVRPNVSLVICLVNIILNSIMLTDWQWRINLFGTKVLLALCLFQFKVQKALQDAPIPLKIKQQVLPEENHEILNSIQDKMPSLKRGNKTRVVSVREKVIDHLKTVQSRLINAP